MEYYKKELNQYSQNFKENKSIIVQINDIYKKINLSENTTKRADIKTNDLAQFLDISHKKNLIETLDKFIFNQGQQLIQISGSENKNKINNISQKWINFLNNLKEILNNNNYNVQILHQALTNFDMIKIL